MLVSLKDITKYLLAIVGAEYYLLLITLLYIDIIVSIL